MGFKLLGVNQSISISLAQHLLNSYLRQNEELSICCTLVYANTNKSQTKDTCLSTASKFTN